LTDIVRVADEYYVRASSALADDRTRVLKSGDTFAVFNRYGDIEDLGASQFGLFHAESRHLSRFTLRLNQKQLMLLSSTIRDDNAFLSIDLTNVDTPQNGIPLPRGTVHIFRAQFLRQASCYEHIRVLNYGLEPVQFVLVMGFDADFADIFEVRGTKRAAKGERLRDRAEGSSAVMSYKGRDGVTRSTRLEFSPQPDSLTTGEACFRITLGPKEETSLYCSVACERDVSTNGLTTFQSALGSLNQVFRTVPSDECRIISSSETFNDWLTRSAADLRMLIDGNPEGPYPYAGVPWFSTVFGRDGIITALECLWLSPRLSESVLRYLAQVQATEENAQQDAEPGKILHEMRRGEMAVTGEVPFARYYGSVDSTPLFVMLAGAYLQRTGNIALIKELWPNVKLALRWIDMYGDCDGDGFVEYRQRSSKGLVQQGWKDSHDSVFHADGRMAEAPIALCEAQGYAYAAKRAGSQLAQTLGESEYARQLEAEAGALREKFGLRGRSSLQPHVLSQRLGVAARHRHCSHGFFALWVAVAGQRTAARTACGQPIRRIAPAAGAFLRISQTGGRERANAVSGCLRASSVGGRLRLPAVASLPGAERARDRAPGSLCQSQSARQPGGSTHREPASAGRVRRLAYSPRGLCGQRGSLAKDWERRNTGIGLTAMAPWCPTSKSAIIEDL
jgi:glycogen debranching enzyme